MNNKVYESPISTEIRVEVEGVMLNGSPQDAKINAKLEGSLLDQLAGQESLTAPKSATLSGKLDGLGLGSTINAE